MEQEQQNKLLRPILVGVYGYVEMTPLNPDRDRSWNVFHRKSLLFGPSRKVEWTSQYLRSSGKWRINQEPQVATFQEAYECYVDQIDWFMKVSFGEPLLI